MKGHRMMVEVQSSWFPLYDRNPWTSVREDVIERANGQRGIYGVIDKDPACIVVPLDVTSEGEF